MSEIRNNRDAVIGILFSKALVKVSSSWTDPKGFVHDDYIVVHEAPPVMVERITRECVMVSLVPDGLLIPVK